jgi:type II secretory pathway pseudopilin PulG
LPVIGRRLSSVRPRRRAFTLVEILLTLGLLVVIAALTLPALDKPFAGVRLREAADQIRAEWATARVRAIESGETHVFQYSLDGEQYLVGGISLVASLHDRSLGAADQVADLAAALPEPVERSLPRDVVFAGSETVIDSRSEALAAELAQAITAERDWSEPIFFFADGTTTSTRLVLKNQYDRAIDVSLRGVTGVSKVSNVRTFEGVSP